MPTLEPITVATIAAICVVAGVLISPLLARLVLFFAEDRPLAKAIGCLGCERTEAWVTSLKAGTCECGTHRPRWPLLLTIWTASLFGTFAWLYFRLRCQQTSDVVPTHFWYYGRFGYHLFLFAVLTVAIGTDLRNYTIADLLMLTGAVAGVGLATVSGDLQTVHIWVDWNQEVPGLYGPYRPDWLSAHPHLHGFAWSVTGMITGAGLTYLLRVTAQYLLQKPALGLGDVTLMAMVGSYAGWQPVTLIMLLAPLLAIAIGIAVWLTTRRAFVAYGPYLALASIIVLSSWRWIWMTDLRLVFGHTRSLVTLAAAAGGTLVLLLGAMRLYQAIPIGTGSHGDGDSGTQE